MKLFNRNNKNESRQNGFTLVEMIVSVAIFTVVMVVGVGALISIIDANRKAQSLNSVMNNLNLALESMSRDIRVGTKYHCGSGTSVPSNIDTPMNCIGGGKLFGFEESVGNPLVKSDQIVYRLYGNGVRNWIEKSVDGGSTFLQITAANVFIDDLTFYVDGAKPMSESSSETTQPLVRIVIRGHAGIKTKTRTDFSLQTSVSQRILDF